MNLILKALSITAGNFSTIMAYETESPYLKGLLIDHRSEKNRRSIEFSFEWRGKTYSIFAFISDEELSKKIMGMISAIRPIDDMNNSYNEMETLYKNKDKARYPEEVLLLSLISIKGPTINNMNALLKIEESKQNNQHAIDAIEGEIDFLMRSQTQKP